MTTMTFNASAPSFRVVARPAPKTRAPLPEMAGRDPLADTYGAVGLRFGLACVPFATLAWLFIAF